VRIVKVTREGRRRSADVHPERPNGIFLGAVDMQTVFDEGADLRLIEVHFVDGARNRPHAHTTDQILVVTEGTGIVATGADGREVHAGDVAFIPAGEVHWHGAKKGHDMTHFAINGRTSRTTVAEEPR
jgi:quercetin dioxygenase-like cupin family protein